MVVVGPLCSVLIGAVRRHLLVIHQFQTTGAAEAFFDSGELRDGMERAGVEGPPTIDIFQDA